MDDVRAETGAAATTEAVVVPHRWMDEDVKATPLKTLQGKIRAAGFAVGELTSHFFADVRPALKRWRAAGTRVAVFPRLGLMTSADTTHCHVSSPVPRTVRPSRVSTPIVPTPRSRPEPSGRTVSVRLSKCPFPPHRTRPSAVGSTPISRR